MVIVVLSNLSARVGQLDTPAGEDQKAEPSGDEVPLPTFPVAAEVTATTTVPPSVGTAGVGVLVTVFTLLALALIVSTTFWKAKSQTKSSLAPIKSGRLS